MIYTQEQVIQLLGSAIAVSDTIKKELEGKIPPISQSRARLIYGHSNIERWKKAGAIHGKRNGKNKNSTLEFSLSELERASQADKLSIRLTNGY